MKIQELVRGVNVVSVNLIFHIVSAITFVVLIWYLLHLQSQVLFMRQLMASLTRPQPKIKVDWPEAFLRRLAAAQGIGFRSNGVKLPAQRIDLRLWAEMSLSLGLEAIEWSAPRCVLRVRREADLKSWGERLEASLQGKITIEWSSAQAPARGV